MGRGDTIGLGVPLRSPMLDALSMAGVAIQALFGVWMRQKVLHGFAMTHLAEISSFFVCNDRRTEEQNK
jgi:hypothetical protein